MEHKFDRMFEVTNVVDHIFIILDILENNFPYNMT